MGHGGDVTEGVAIGEAQRIRDRGVVRMGVELNDVNWLGEGAHSCKGNRMIAPEHHRHCAGVDRGTDHVGLSGEGALRVCRMDVDVADIRNQAAFDLFSQIVPPRRYVVEPGAPGGKPGPTNPPPISVNHTTSSAPTPTIPGMDCGVGISNSSMV